MHINYLLEKQPIVIFDGVCNFCNQSVNLIIKNNKNKNINFAPLQSNAAKQLLTHFNMPTNYNNSIIFIENNTLYTKSAAVFKIIKHLGLLKYMRIFSILPTSLNNYLYDIIAENRYKWFGKADSCMIPTPELKARFLA